MALDVEKKLSEKDLEQETVLNALVDRVNKEPNEKTKEALYSALKDAFVYIPSRILLDKEEAKKAQEAFKAKKSFTPDPSKIRFAFVLLENKQVEEKILPMFTKQDEAKNLLKDGKMPDGMGMVRLPVVKALSVADNMPEAFDVAFDPFSHIVKLPLDEVLENVLPEKQDGEE